MRRITTFATAFIAVLTLGFMVQSCTPKIEKEQLAGYWTLKTLKGEVAKDAFKGSIPSIEFNFEENMVSGSAGCNRYHGGYTLVENKFTAPQLVSTMMMCAEDNKEDLFTATLGNAEGLTISLNNDVLSFKINDEVVIEFVKGEAPVANANQGAQPVKPATVVGKWVLTTISGDDASKLFSEKPVTMEFGDEGTVFGNAGCNNYRTNVTFEDNTLTFGPLMSTKMACPSLEGEQKFTEILSKPLQATINGDKLFFLEKGNDVLVFTKSKESAE